MLQCIYAHRIHACEGVSRCVDYHGTYISLLLQTTADVPCEMCTAFAREAKTIGDKDYVVREHCDNTTIDFDVPEEAINTQCLVVHLPRWTFQDGKNVERKFDIQSFNCDRLQSISTAGNVVTWKVTGQAKYKTAVDSFL